MTVDSLGRHATMLPPSLWPALLGNARAIVEAHRDEQECGLCPAYPDGECARLAWADRLLADPMMLAVERDVRDGVPLVRVMDLPPVPAGTVIHLGAGEWSDGEVFPDLATNLRVTRAHVDTAVPDATEVWVTGHWLECGWESAEQHPPCADLLVRTRSIVVALAAAGQP